MMRTTQTVLTGLAAAIIIATGALAQSSGPGASAPADQVASKPAATQPQGSKPANAAKPAAQAAKPAAQKTKTAARRANPVGYPLSSSKEPRPYYVEFRARNALSYGHTFAVHGKIGTKLTSNMVVGLHPFTESSVPWMLGHLVPVPSETGFSDGDIEDEYLLASYRVLLTEAEYAKLTDYLRGLKASSPVWHAVLYNCNAFVADIAKSMGLRTPSSTLLMPKEFITELRDLNVATSRSAGGYTASISLH